MYLRVIWRFRLIMAAGFFLALALAVLSYTRIGFKDGRPSISYAQAETWQGSTTLAITQGGFPWGAIAPTNFPGTGRFNELASYYSVLANSDAVQRQVDPHGDIPGTLTASPVLDPSGRFGEPFLRFDGFAPNPRAAVRLANRGAAVFQKYLRQQQDAADIPAYQRVSLHVTNQAQGAILFAGRRKTTPVVIFLTIMLAAIGLAFILENLRPRVHLVGKQSEEMRATERSVGGQRNA
jgi:hypothetical protein